MTTNKTPRQNRARKLKHAALTSRNASFKIAAPGVTSPSPSSSPDSTTQRNEAA